ncbi:sugar-binding protein [Paenibacillus guangzhouensis]|uniref:sugar-binding protein n=1 Tax=Paenibacillus guangzhouensis TaxID=1473112 RepID=UPI00187B773B|nr:sugar-binding protein [Paenibacillus guangzhouensis]
MLVLLLCAWPMNGLLISENYTAYAVESLHDTPIGDFESDEEVWNFSLGTEFPGAVGEFVRDSSVSKSGTYAGKLHGDFNVGGKYVGIGKNFSSIDMQKLEFWVKSADASAIVLRVTDATGQVHQQKIAITSIANWQKIEIAQFNGGTNYLHFNGANDGVWHGPAKGIGILLEKAGLIGGKTSGDVWIDAVSAIAPQQDPLWDAEIGTFEKAFDLWRMGLGTDFPGASGQYVRDTMEPKSGLYAGKLRGDFSAGGKYISLGKSFSPIDIQKIAFWIKTADATSISLRLKDATGQVHQQKITLSPTTNWQKIEIYKLDGGQNYLYFGGANDGKWHGPAQQMEFLLEKSGLNGGKSIGEIRLDNVVLTAPFPDLSIQQTRMGNIFLENEPVAFDIATQGDSVSWSVYDHLDHKVLAGTGGVQSGQLKLSIPLQQFGYYSLRIEAKKNGQLIKNSEVTLARLSSAASSTVASSPFGMSTHLAWETPQGWTPELSELLNRAGVKNFRDEIPWDAVEYEIGKYRKPSNRDAYMQRTQQDGLKPFIILDYTNPFYDQNSTPYTDQGRQGFANYGKALLNLYGDQIPWVEVYNEFNGGFGDRGNGPADSRPEYYYQLLKKTYETIKAARPDVTVVGMATAGTPLGWMEEVFKLGGLQYMDAISIHPYQSQRPPEGIVDNVRSTKNLIRQYNQGQLKPIWFTEVGWPTSIGGIGISEKTQADYLVRTHVLALAEGVEKVFWYDLMNDGMDPSYHENNFGILRNSNDPKGAFTPKPSYAAYAGMTRELIGAQFIQQDSFGTGISSYQFHKNGQNLRVVWANTPVQAAILTNNPIQITDMMGNTDTFTPLHGKVYMTLTGEPIYVKSEIEGIAVDSTFTLVAEEAIAGEPVTMKVETDNIMDTPIDVSVQVENSVYPLFAASGQKTSLSITLPGRGQIGERYVTADLTANGEQIGKLQHAVRTSSAYDAKVVPVIHDMNKKTEALRLQIRNRSKTEGLSVRNVDWKFGTQSGTEALNKAIPPNTLETFDIPLSGFEYGVSYPAQATVSIDGKESYKYEGMLDFNPLIRSTVQIDGVADPNIMAIPPLVSLSRGTIKMQNYAGSSDLDGSIWANWDQDAFYLTAKVKDDVHSTPASGEEIWKNDSIQFALMNGIPGENLGWYEIGISDTPQGPQIYRWLSADTSAKGIITKGSLQVKRDEARKETLYELALPWSELTPIRPDANEAISLSFLVNDNDGLGRKGYIEWGSGIGEVKDAKKFRTAQWVQDPYSPVITIQGVAEGESYVDQVAPVVKAETANGEILTPRIWLDGEAWTSGTPITANGIHTLTVQAGDPGGKLSEQKLSFKLYHSTVLELSNAEGHSNDIVSLKSTLHDKQGRAISGASVSYAVYGGEPIGYAVTDTDGVAALPYKIETKNNMDQETIYTITVFYSPKDTAYFLSSEGYGQLTVKPASKPDPDRIPGHPVLSGDNGYDSGIQDGTYTITMNMWWGDNGSTYRLYENDVLIDTQSLTDHSPLAQTAVTSISNRKNGTYRYVAELSNAAGSTRSNVYTVTVTQAEPAQPVLSHDNWDGDGSYKVSMNMWWGTNGTVYRLYENGILIDTQILNDHTPNAQSATTDIHGKQIGTYEYRCELVNDAGTTSSEKTVITVSK